MALIELLTFVQNLLDTALYEHSQRYSLYKWSIIYYYKPSYLVHIIAAVVSTVSGITPEAKRQNILDTVIYESPKIICFLIKSTV